MRALPSALLGENEYDWPISEPQAASLLQGSLDSAYYFYFSGTFVQIARCTVQCLTVTSKDGQVSTLPTLMPPEERWKTWQLPLVHLVDDASS